MARLAASVASENESAQVVSKGGHDRGRRHRDDPRDHDIACQAPAHGPHALRRTYADDGTRDRVRRRHRDPQARRHEQRDGTAGLGRKPPFNPK